MGRRALEYTLSMVALVCIKILFLLHVQDTGNSAVVGPAPALQTLGTSGMF